MFAGNVADMSEARLQKILSRAGIDSRRACEALIAAGRVTVNGRVATLGESADPSIDEVLLDGNPIHAVPSVVIALNKPCGYLSAMKDERGGRCVSELLPLDRFPGLFHVGRLDVDTSGLLLFTTDGELGNTLAHPSHEIWKTYVAHVEGRVTDAELQKLREGVFLDDGLTLPAHADLCSCDPTNSEVLLRIREGRNRQVRRMLAAVGHPVLDLKRTAIGALTLEGLAEGSWRELTPEEIRLLF